ncbi:SUKH-4 family immunity protein [Nonomuraea maritima]|nr:SUKH-4 family immunity protein [Nonomuraea maritima]
MGTWCLFLDGRTGLVYEVHEGLEAGQFAGHRAAAPRVGQQPARVAHRSVESYAYFVYVVHRERRLWCEGRDTHREAAYWCADDLALELHTYEPEAMAGDDALRPPTLEDYTLLTGRSRKPSGGSNGCARRVVLKRSPGGLLLDKKPFA